MTAAPLPDIGTGTPVCAPRSFWSRVGQAARAGAGCAAVLVALAAALALFDRLPGLLAGLPRGATRVASQAQAERALGFAFPFPVFYPSDLAWPPDEFRLYPGPSAVAIVHSAKTGNPALVIGTAAPGIPAVAPELVPPGVVLQASESTFGARRVTVARIQDADGALWHEAAWTAHGRAIVVRYRGDVIQLSRMVESMAR